jgi:HK97 gp10 family phage protein
VAISFDVTLEGGDELVLRLRVWQFAKRRAVAALIVRTCLAIEADAKRDVRVDTGRLRAAIRTDVRSVLEDLVGVVKAGTDYARWVEFGTDRMAAHPYLLPAWEAHRRAYFDGLVSILSSPRP